MHQVKTVELDRDVPAVQIPSGEPAILPKGTVLDITQTLGGSFTVRTGMGLFRIDGAHADALGEEAGAPAKPAPAGPVKPLTEAEVWQVLKSCYDPEIPVNIVDLGLIYDLVIEPAASGRSHVKVKMTLTAPGCGMGPVIAGDAQARIMELDNVETAEVSVVWDPPWHQSMITADGRKVLGLD